LDSRLDSRQSTPDLDLGPAVARLRFFRFAEFILVFLTIVAVAVFAGLYALRDEAAALERQFGASFSPAALNLALAMLAAAIFAGILTYRAAGKLRAGPLRWHRIILPVAGIAFLVTGLILGMQFERMMHRATMTRLLPAPSAFKLMNLQFDPLFGMQPPATRQRIVAEIKEEIRKEQAASAARAAEIEQAALPRIGLAEFNIGAAIAAALGLWGLLGFARTRLGPDTTPMTYLDAVEKERRKQTPPRGGGTPVNRPLGLLFLAAGIGILIGQLWLPPLNLVLTAVLAAVISVAVFVALFRAKQYLQTSADSLLGRDKRPPILFLRSFSDDPKVNAAAGITHEGLAQLIDLSVETRLANHFMCFGPFIAISSPQETVPQVGAARVKLSDAEWQVAVTDWMETASVIVMYAGTTPWVGWELQRIIEGGWTDKLIILFPPVLPFPGFWQGSWLKRQKADIAARFERLKATFAGTKWAEAWAAAEPETVICARLEADGGVHFTRSRRRSKDAYDLAAKIAHLALRGALPPEKVPETSDSRRVEAS
jgi:hypothetical protein